MKYFLLPVLGILLSFSLTAQLTDLDIAQSLIQLPGDSIETKLNSFDIDYWITENKEGKVSLYISYDNSVRAWTLDVGNVSRKLFDVNTIVARDIVKKVFIRYRHSNLNDLRDFYKYEIPTDTEFTKYEKQLGEDVSHFKIMQY